MFDESDIVKVNQNRSLYFTELLKTPDFKVIEPADDHVYREARSYLKEYNRYRAEIANCRKLVEVVGSLKKEITSLEMGNLSRLREMEQQEKLNGNTEQLKVIQSLIRKEEYKLELESRKLKLIDNAINLLKAKNSVETLKNKILGNMMLKTFGVIYSKLIATKEKKWQDLLLNTLPETVDPNDWANMFLMYRELFEETEQPKINIDDYRIKEESSESDDDNIFI
ncbi:MAG: hypothetical protein KatS3mg101_0811 [Patescibacteria group bacterium]|nr:MAG: hypothetical protein KatS3mg101_0811 [Patescibacteria group bacterium]